MRAINRGVLSSSTILQMFKFFQRPGPSEQQNIFEQLCKSSRGVIEEHQMNEFSSIPVCKLRNLCFPNIAMTF
jgi:hypothetical protein